MPDLRAPKIVSVSIDVAFMLHFLSPSCIICLNNIILCSFVSIQAPELLDRWVGGSERLVRELFHDAEAELASVNGDASRSALHVIVSSSRTTCFSLHLLNLLHICYAFMYLLMNLFLFASSGD